MAEKSAWHAIPIGASDPDETFVIRESFSSKGYTIQVSNLVQVWSESLDRREIIQRADDSECCIEPTEPDQLGILLDHISGAINSRGGTELRLRKGEQCLELNITSKLPEPLPNLQWLCSLSPLPAGSLKTQVLMPLLGSVHVMKLQIDELSNLLLEKDGAINKMIDKIDSSRIDLSSIFPIPSSKMSLTRQKELINERVQGMKPFEKDDWLARMNSPSNATLSYVDLLNEGFSQSGSKRVGSILDSIQHHNTRMETRAPSVAEMPERAGKPAEGQGESFEEFGFLNKDHVLISKAPGEENARVLKTEPSPETIRKTDLVDEASTTEDESDHEHVDEASTTEDESDNEPVRDGDSSSVRQNEQTNNDQSDVRPNTAESGASTASELSSASAGRRIGVIGGQSAILSAHSPHLETGNVTETQSKRRLGEIGGTSYSEIQNGSKQNSAGPSFTKKEDATKQDSSLEPAGESSRDGRERTAGKTEETRQEKMTENRREELKRELEHKSQAQNTKKKRRF